MTRAEIKRLAQSLGATLSPEVPADCLVMIPRREPLPKRQRPPETLTQVFYNAAWNSMKPTSRLHDECREIGLGRLVEAMRGARGFAREDR